MLIIFDPNDPVEVRKAKELNERMVRLAISLEGTCTGEHGVGQGKKVGAPSLLACHLTETTWGCLCGSC